MFKLLLTIIFSMALNLPSLALAQDSDKENLPVPVKGPVFSQYGPVFKVMESDVPLIKDFKYKVFFSISQSSQDTSSRNGRIESVARFINMHAMNGVKLENMDISVVLLGGATRDAFSQEAYQERFLDDNPTLDLIEQLHAKGVKFYLCGQSLYFQKAKKSDLAPQVNLALSAMTMSTMLQAQGYSLIP